MKQILLTQGKVALVDDEDYEWLNQWKWCLWKRKKPHYPDYAIRTSYENGKQKTLWMHRLITNAQKGQEIDHINHNGLDNRKVNLRVCTGSQNQHNQRVLKRGKSQFKGVYWDKNRKKWRAIIISLNTNSPIHIGRFNNEIEAAKAYNTKATELFGEFACLNEVA